jgi:hypothetical protein
MQVGNKGWADHRRKKRWRVAATLGAVTLAALVLSAWRSRTRFDQQVWRRSCQFSTGGWVHPLDARRLRMVNDLMSNHIHAGMMRGEIRASLGDPQFADGTGPSLAEGYLLAMPATWLEGATPIPMPKLWVMYAGPPGALTVSRIWIAVR